MKSKYVCAILFAPILFPCHLIAWLLAKVFMAIQWAFEFVYELPDAYIEILESVKSKT